MRQMIRPAMAALLVYLLLFLPGTSFAQNAFRERLLPTDENYGFRMDDY